MHQVGQDRPKDCSTDGLLSDKSGFSQMRLTNMTDDTPSCAFEGNLILQDALTSVEIIRVLFLLRSSESINRVFVRSGSIHYRPDQSKKLYSFLFLKKIKNKENFKWDECF